MTDKPSPAIQPYPDLCQSEKTRQAVQEALSEGYYRYAKRHHVKEENPYKPFNNGCQHGSENPGGAQDRAARGATPQRAGERLAT